MTKQSTLFLLLVVCGVPTLSQYLHASAIQAATSLSTQSPNPRPAPKKEAFMDRPNTFLTDSYRMTVESIQRKANNFTVTLVFESLSDKVIQLRLGKSKFAWQDSWDQDGPYLADEKSNKYILQGLDSGGVVNCSGCSFAELLPNTKLKTQLLFFGTGNGTTFSFIATERSPVRGRVIAIKGLKAISTDQLTDAKTFPESPTLATESYRVVVTNVERDAENIIVTLIFENLLDRAFNIEWGEGRNGDNDVWEGKEPYLIDENADRYYLRERDKEKVVYCGWCETAELLPGTKLKTRLIFRISGNGTTFTLACKERSPKNDRPVVIQGLKAK